MAITAWGLLAKLDAATHQSAGRKNPPSTVSVPTTTASEEPELTFDELQPLGYLRECKRVDPYEAQKFDPINRAHEICADATYGIVEVFEDNLWMSRDDALEVITSTRFS